MNKTRGQEGRGSVDHVWRVFEGDKEYLFKHLDITVPVWDETDGNDWDTARGIVTGNDPHLSLNTTAAEVTTDDSIDPYSPGFTVNQISGIYINVTSATYIFLAIA